MTSAADVVLEMPNGLHDVGVLCSFIRFEMVFPERQHGKNRVITLSIAVRVDKHLAGIKETNSV
jgi:hypothetical protein